MQRKIPLPDEQPVAVNALRNMRARIAGQIEMHSREIDRLRADLVHLDVTMRLFDPDTDPDDIPAIRGYPRRTEWFARGEVTRLVYEAIRDKKIIWPREIAKAAMAAKGIPETDKAIRKDIVSRFTNVAYDLTRRGQLVKIGHGEGARWKLAPKERILNRGTFAATFFLATMKAIGREQVNIADV